MSKEAMKLALEALEIVRPMENPEPIVENAITALREELAEQPTQQEPVPAAMKTVIQAMQQDPEYAWGWHCNIAMAFVDAGGDHYIGNQGAARFMKLLANVEPAHALPTSQAPTQEPEQPAKRHGYKEAYIEAMVASNEAGFVGLSAAETIRELANMLDKRAEQPAQQETKELFGYEIWNLFYRTKEELFEALVDKGIEWATPRGTENGLNKEWIEANIREVYVHGTYALAEREAAKKGGAS